MVVACCWDVESWLPCIYKSVRAANLNSGLVGIDAPWARLCYSVYRAQAEKAKWALALTVSRNEPALGSRALNFSLAANPLVFSSQTRLFHSHRDSLVKPLSSVPPALSSDNKLQRLHRHLTLRLGLTEKGPLFKPHEPTSASFQGFFCSFLSFLSPQRIKNQGLALHCMSADRNAVVGFIFCPDH